MYRLLRRGKTMNVLNEYELIKLWVVCVITHSLVRCLVNETVYGT